MAFDAQKIEDIAGSSSNDSPSGFDSSQIENAINNSSEVKTEAPKKEIKKESSPESFMEFRERSTPKIPYISAGLDAFGENVKNAFTALPRAAISGVSGIAKGAYDKAQGKSFLDSAVNTSNNINQELSPVESNYGKSLQSALESNYNPLTWIPKGAEKLGGMVAENQHPELGAAISTAGSLINPMKLAGIARIPIAEKGQSNISNTGTYQKPSIEDLNPRAQQVLRQLIDSGKVSQKEIDNHIEAETLPIPLRYSKGQASGDPSILSQEHNQRSVNGFDQLKNDQNQKLIENLFLAKEKAAPESKDSNMIDHGQAQVDALKSTIENDRARVNDAYKQLADANGGKLPVDAQTFANNAKKALSEGEISEFLPKEFTKKIEEYSSGKEMNYDNFENLRTMLARAARNPQNDGNVTHALSVVRQELENLPLPQNVAENIKPLADNARSASREVFKKIESNPAYKAVYNDEAKPGEYSPLADSFTQKYILKAPRANVEKLMSQLPPEGRSSVSASVIDHLKESAGLKANEPSGNFRAAGYNNALDKISPKIDMLLDPETVHLLGHIGSAANTVTKAPAGSYIQGNPNLAATLAAQAGNISTFGVLPKIIKNAQVKKQQENISNPLGKKSLSDILKSTEEQK